MHNGRAWAAKKKFSGTLYIDEGLVVNPGSILYAACMLKARRVIVMRDRNQIPYIEKMYRWRSSWIIMLCYHAIGVQVSEKLTSYRCFADVCAYMTSKYGGLVTSRNNAASPSVSHDVISSLKSVASDTKLRRKHCRHIVQE